jgi:hypothetical protein
MRDVISLQNRHGIGRINAEHSRRSLRSDTLMEWLLHRKITIPRMPAFTSNCFQESWLAFSVRWSISGWPNWLR